MGHTSQCLRLAEAVSSRFRESPCLTKQDGERKGQIRLWLLHVHTHGSTPAFTTYTGWGGGACERTGCCEQFCHPRNFYMTPNIWVYKIGLKINLTTTDHKEIYFKIIFWQCIKNKSNLHVNEIDVLVFA